MKTYTIPIHTKAWRGKVHRSGTLKGKLMLGTGYGWEKIYTNKEVTYTEIDLRSRLKVTDLDYHEFNLPEKAEPYGVLAVRAEDVVTAAWTPTHPAPAGT
jgi:hypothetical protein